MTENNRQRLRNAQLAAAKQKRLNRIIAVGAGVIGAVLIAVIAIVMVQNMNQNAEIAASQVTPPNATEDGKSIVVNPGKAEAGAPVVELFFDYQCPVCKQLETALGATLEDLADTGKIELRYRTMSFLDANLKNDSSVQAGIAATCGAVVGKYAETHDAIFAIQPATEGDGYPTTELRDSIPATVGLTGADLTNFQTCFDDGDTKAFVEKSNELGMQDMISVNSKVATPTIFVNGNNLPLNELAAGGTGGVLDAILAKA